MTPRAGLAHASEETRNRAIRKWQDDPDRPHVFKYIAEEWLGGVFSESSVRSWIRDYQRTGIVKPASGAGSRFWVNRSLYSQHALDEMHRMLQEDNGLKPAEVLVKTHLRTGEVTDVDDLLRAPGTRAHRELATECVALREHAVGP